MICHVKANARSGVERHGARKSKKDQDHRELEMEKMEKSGKSRSGKATLNRHMTVEQVMRLCVHAILQVSLTAAVMMV